MRWNFDCAVHPLQSRVCRAAWARWELVWRRRFGRVWRRPNSMSEQIREILDIPRDFVKDGMFFLNRCTKPSKRGSYPVVKGFDDVEFLEISRAVAVGFLVMGFIGYAVKLVHIPINNILV